MKLLFQGAEKECYASVIKVQITANKKWINLVLVYGLGETTMMLASNIPIKSKEDVIKTNVYLWFYQLARGIYNILSKTRCGIREWEDIRKTKEYDGQLCLL